SNRYVVGNGWGVAQSFDGSAADSVLYTGVVCDRGGGAVAIWWQSAQNQGTVWVKRFTPAGGWEASRTLSTDLVPGAGTGSIPVVVMDPSGNAVAVWTQGDYVKPGVWAARFQ